MIKNTQYHSTLVFFCLFSSCRKLLRAPSEKENFSIFTDESGKLKNTRIFNEKNRVIFYKNLPSMYCVTREKWKIENCECESMKYFCEIFFSMFLVIRRGWKLIFMWQKIIHLRNFLNDVLKIKLFPSTKTLLMFSRRYIVTPVRCVFDRLRVRSSGIFFHVFLPIFP